MCSTKVGTALHANTRLGWKDLPKTNTLVYFAATSMTKEKSFLDVSTNGCSRYSSHMAADIPSSSCFPFTGMPQ